jgi:hypothetical protein
MFGNLHALAAFHDEGLGDDCHCQYAELSCNLRNDWRCPGSRTAAHTGSDKQHVSAIDHFQDTIAIFHRSLSTNIWVSTSSETLCDVAPDLQRRSRARALQRLRIRIGTDEIDTVYAGVDHVSNGITPAATDTDDFDNSARAMRIH